MYPRPMRQSESLAYQSKRVLSVSEWYAEKYCAGRVGEGITRGMERNVADPETVLPDEHRHSFIVF